MSKRHQSREIVLRTLYNLDILGDLHSYINIDTAINILAENNKLSPDDIVDDKDYSQAVFRGILDKITTIDEIISKAAPEWPIDKINIIDRNILRIGIFEILFAADNGTPPRVAINESVELAKEYSSNKSSGFVNGVLGSIYKELYDKSSENMSDGLDKEEILNIICIPYNIHKDIIYIGFIEDSYKKWSFAKDTQDNNLQLEDNIIQILNNKFAPVSNIIEYSKITVMNNYKEINDKKIKSIDSYYLVNIDNIETNPLDKINIKSAKWVRIDEINKLSKYSEMTNVLNKIYEKLSWTN